MIYRVDSRVVFWAKIPREEYVALSAAILSGTSTGYDCEDAIMDRYVANSDLYRMQNRVFGSTDEEKILSNIALSPSVIATVRAGLLNMENGAANFMQLQSAVALIQVGMFTTAASVLSSMTPAGFLSRGRLDRYASMISSADAIG